MLQNFPLQFAVVREDPQILASVINSRSKTVNQLLLIGSGGCQALSLAAMFPDMSFTLIDQNLTQLQHVQQKAEALKMPDSEQKQKSFNIADSYKLGLNQCGQFESLFRGFREFIFDLICSYEQLRLEFEKAQIHQVCEKILFSNKYWPVAFDLFFSDSLLNAMFGNDATQHAPSGSYPKYFQERLELGLRRHDAGLNYFLHHIFLGHYLKDQKAWPEYLKNSPVDPNFTYLNSGIETSELEIASFDLIDLSNIFDWMSEDSVKSIAKKLNVSMKPGSQLVFRQLNNHRDLSKYFPELQFDREYEKQLLNMDRSLFYNLIRVGRKHG